MSVQLSSCSLYEKSSSCPGGMRPLRPFRRDHVAGDLQPCREALPSGRNADVCPVCSCRRCGMCSRSGSGQLCGGASAQVRTESRTFCGNPLPGGDAGSAPCAPERHGFALIFPGTCNIMKQKKRKGEDYA